MQIHFSMFLQHRQIRIPGVFPGVFKSFPELISIFLTDEVRPRKYEKLNCTGVNEGINTCNMAENSAHQMEWRIDGNTTRTITGTSLSPISSDVLGQIIDSRLFCKAYKNSKIK